MSEQHPTEYNPETHALAVTLPVVGIGDEFAIVAGYPDRSDTLTYLQGQVGGYVDAIEIVEPETGEVATLWIPDEGKITGQHRNFLAEMVATHGGWAGREHGDWIAGPCVVTGHNPETGDTIGIESAWQHTLALIIDTYGTVLKAATERAMAEREQAPNN